MMRTSITIAIAIAIAAAVALACLPGTARAQAVDKEQRAEAEQLFRAGERAYNAGQYVSAAQAFEKAWEIVPLPAIAFSAAQAYRLQYFTDKKAGRLKRAIELYRLYLERAPDGSRRVDASTSLAELEPIMARIEVESGTVKAEVINTKTTQLMVTSQIEGAIGTIDGGDAMPLPLVREVKAGKHDIVVEADGYFRIEQKADVVDGQFRVVEIELNAKPALVTIRTAGGAQVTVDGRPIGTTPIARPIELPAGKHFVSVIKRGRRAWGREIEVGRGEKVELTATLDTTGQRKLSYWVMGGGLAGFATAGVFGYLALGDDSDASDLDAKRESESLSAAEAARYADLVDSRDDNKTMMYTFAGVGGVLVATGALMYFIDTPRAEMQPTSSGPVVAPLVGRDLAGFAVTGSF
jgi:tetratricopeptide (TPR) repeat protein